MLLRLIPCLALAACATASSRPLAPADEFSLQQAADSIPLAQGRDVKVGDTWLRFAGVTRDSRCPEGVMCVWAGDAEIALVVHPPCYAQGCKAASVVLALHTGVEPRSGTGWGRRVTLVALTPGPVTGTPTDPSRYVAWVRVQ